MGVLALSDFQSEILAGLGNRTDIPLARIVTHLNLSQMRLARAADFRELQRFQILTLTITSNEAVDKYLTLPVGLTSVHSMVLIDNTGGSGSLLNSRKMKQLTWRKFDSEYPVPEGLPRGWPSVYTIWGGDVAGLGVYSSNPFNAILVPVPQSAFNIDLRFSATPTAFSVSQLTQVSDFIGKDDILLELTLSRFFELLGRDDKATSYLQRAVQDTKEAIDRENIRPDLTISSGNGDDDVAAGAYYLDPFITAVRGS